MSIWNVRGPQDDVVISSRVRLARNVAGMPFPSAMNDAQGIEISKRIAEAIKTHPDASQYKTLQLRTLDERQGQELVERHLISPAILKNIECAAVIMKDNEDLSIMVNEEDHLRIQCMLSGERLEEAMQQALDMAEYFEKTIPLAFSPTLGYLSACPTNVGTGMRASVMMHLPALKMTSQLKAIIDSAPKSGIVVRGIYGEGSDAIGDLYQISNQTTLGLTEDEICEGIHGVCSQIAERERQMRELLKNERANEIQDALLRSYGILRNARRMESKEFMRRISDLRLAVQMGYVQGIDPQEINMLMISGQNAALRRTSEQQEAAALDAARSTLARKALRNTITMEE